VALVPLVFITLSINIFHLRPVPPSPEAPASSLFYPGGQAGAGSKPRSCPCRGWITRFRTNRASRHPFSTRASGERTTRLIEGCATFMDG
jgi:hypothetical protein